MIEKKHINYIILVHTGKLDIYFIIKSFNKNMNNQLSHSLLRVYICCSLIFKLLTCLKNLVRVFKSTHYCLFSYNIKVHAFKRSAVYYWEYNNTQIVYNKTENKCSLCVWCLVGRGSRLYGEGAN